MAGEDRGPQVAGVAAFFLTLSTIFVALRVYCRVVVVKAFGADDYLAVIAWACYAFFCGFAIAGVHYGTGRHTVDIVPITNVPIGLKWWWACEPVYVLANLAIKFSIGIFLLRLAVKPVQRLILYTVMAVSGLMGTMYFFLFVFQCNPPQYFWERFAGTGAQGHCLDTIIIVNSTYAYSAMSCWSDWTYCILPGFMVWGLNMNIRTKISVMILLGLSAIASIATIARFPYIGGLNDAADFLWATTDVAIWSCSETGIGITTACGATLRPLVRNFLSRSRLLGGSTTEANSTKNPWPSSKTPARAGYVKSSQHGRDNSSGDEEIALRGDLKSNTGVTTTVSGDDRDDMIEERMRQERRAPNGKGLRQWGENDDKLADSSSETSDRKESRWSIGGIRKTTEFSTRRA